MSKTPKYSPTGARIKCAHLRDLRRQALEGDLWAGHELMKKTGAESVKQAAVVAQHVIDKFSPTFESIKQSKNAPPPPKGRWLYRMWSANDRLLYVGITDRGRIREKEHARNKPWWSEVHSITYMRVPTREELVSIEAEAIRRERPKYNVQHNGGWRTVPVRK